MTYRVLGRRAVDQDREVSDILVQPRREKRTVERFLRQLLKALKSKFKSKGPFRPVLCDWVAA